MTQRCLLRWSLALAVAAVVCFTVANAASDCSASLPGGSSGECGMDLHHVASGAVDLRPAHDPYVPSASSDPPRPERVQHMWTTPILVSRSTAKDLGKFNRALSELAVKAYRAVVAREDVALAGERGDSAEGNNERFFQWQQEQHSLPAAAQAAEYKSLVNAPEFLRLLRTFESASVQFLKSVGKDKQWLSEHTTRGALFCWGTVAAGGNYHLSHTHPGHQVSGVYYSRIPRGSGSILFDDPRGPRWPFDGRWIHEPQAGEMILFPSWLVHQVAPTQGKDERVSFSCNTQGNWEDLSDVNLA